ncbi:MAG: redoxin domain-containing protein [Candidatus Eremiobacteraeota bacterium]|nr:redoxin domain-containing protein [Candidatus Eremiobacteraeota bacterium]
MKRSVYFLAALMAASFAPAQAAQSFAPLATATSWLNAPASPESLRGKVVIVDVFTFDCINCRHVVPELRTLYHGTSRHDLAIVGVHSPELPEERVRANVVAALAEQGIVWPVAIDNDFALWHAFGVDAWPTQFVFDRNGMLRDTIVGEGNDERLAADVRRLIAEKR